MEQIVNKGNLTLLIGGKDKRTQQASGYQFANRPPGTPTLNDSGIAHPSEVLQPDALRVEIEKFVRHRHALRVQYRHISPTDERPTPDNLLNDLVSLSTYYLIPIPEIPSAGNEERIHAMSDMFRVTQLFMAYAIGTFTEGKKHAAAEQFEEMHARQKNVHAQADLLIVPPHEYDAVNWLLHLVDRQLPYPKPERNLVIQFSQLQKNLVDGLKNKRANSHISTSNL